MLLRELDKTLVEKIAMCSTVGELKEILMAFIDHSILLQKTLNDALEHLDSDNIESIDCAKTEMLNPDSALGNYATKTWVMNNFTEKV